MGSDVGVERSDRRELEKRLRIRPALVHEIVREEGEEELRRGRPALWWSGLAAGLSMGFSLVATGLLTVSLPAEPWANPIVALGYSAGFLIVVLGRQQLFTENTITALLPVISNRSGSDFVNMLRLWGIVLTANLVGAALIAAGLAFGQVLPGEAAGAFVAVGMVYAENPAITNLTSGVLAGWLIAAMVWTMPSAPNSRFVMVIFFTWLIGLGHFTHIVAGAVNMFYLVFVGQGELGSVVLRFLLPTLVGNVIGGSALFALITYAQVREEVEPGGSS